MKFGLSDDQFRFLFQTVIEPLKKMGFQVYIFGSRARGQHHPFSDIDILFEGNSSPDLNTKIIQIKQEAQDSNFPFKIDLVYSPDLVEGYKSNVLQNRISD